MRSGKRRGSRRAGQAQQLVALGLAPNDRMWVPDRDRVSSTARPRRRSSRAPHLDGAHVRSRPACPSRISADDLARADGDDAWCLRRSLASQRAAILVRSRRAQPWSRRGSRSRPRRCRRSQTVPRRSRRSRPRSGSRRSSHPFGRQREGKLSPLDQQVIVAEPVPLRELHRRSRPGGDRQAG